VGGRNQPPQFFVKSAAARFPPTPLRWRPISWRLPTAPVASFYGHDTKLEIPDDWTATPDNVNALPEPLRRYIHDLQTNTDPAGLMRENFTLRQENAGLRLECERLAAQLGTKPR
jgi:hypothetical protein